MPNSVSWTVLSVVLAVSSFAFASHAGAETGTIAPSAVSGMETAPVDGDIYRYKAVLAESEEGADLYIFTDAGDGWTQDVYAKDIVWRGGIGQEPWIETTEKGALKVYSENSSIGRNRWEQILTIAYRNGRFLVAGYTYTYYDTLDPESNGICDVNLLTGKGELNDKTFRTSLKALPVEEWTMDTRPPECNEN
ncbi:hypothetical protein [uncultured Roseibium sp.]|uniref:hypothetical protein n=1 Tax=uncultured Roseibium sp. TaxID=1936171 RepID=UPI00263731D9|nr:hypothetical protein [uncultured Roseibium sp.]